MAIHGQPVFCYARKAKVFAGGQKSWEYHIAENIVRLFGGNRNTQRDIYTVPGIWLKIPVPVVSTLKRH